MTKNQGFTLVEVALALGLVTFALLALLGLLSTLTTQSKDARDDIALTNIFNTTVKTVEAASTGSDPVPAEIFTDMDGGKVSNEADAIYRVEIEKITPTRTPLLPTTSNSKIDHYQARVYRAAGGAVLKSLPFSVLIL